MKTFLLGLALALSFYGAEAQFKFAGDVRGGETYRGISLIYMPAPHQAVHLVGVTNKDFTSKRVALYYEEHYKFFGSKWLSYFGGCGIHLGARTITREYPDAKDQLVTSSRVLFGTDLIGGLETTIPGTPIRVAVDVIPYIDLILQGSYIDGSLRIGVQF